jgi:hypothetical protein
MTNTITATTITFNVEMIRRLAIKLAGCPAFSTHSR